MGYPTTPHYPTLPHAYPAAAPRSGRRRILRGGGFGVALPGFEGDGLGGPRLANSFRALKTAVWHRLDAALTGSRSYFGALVPCKKLDFWRPGMHFCSIVSGRAGPWPGGPHVHFQA